MSRDFSAVNPAALAGIDIWERERIDLSSMPWFTRDYGSTQERSAPRASRIIALIPRSIRFWAWICFAVLCILFALPAIPMVATAVEQARLLVTAVSPEAANPVPLGPDVAGSFVSATLGVMTYLFLGPVLALFAGRRRARRQRGLARYLLYVAAEAVLCLQLVSSVGMAGAWPLLLPLALFVLTVELFRAASPSLAGRGLLSRADVRRYNRWGLPGGGYHLSARAVPDAAAAQIMTAQLIDALLQTIPGAKAVHGVRVPGTDGVVHHVVLCGRRLAVIGSESWSGGEAYWLNGSLMYSGPGYRPQVVPSSFPDMPAAFASAFPRLEVRGWLVLHPNDRRDIKVNNLAAGSNPLIATPGSFLTEVGEWLGEEHPARVRRRTPSALVLQHQR